MKEGKAYIALLVELVSELSVRTCHRGHSYVNNGTLEAIGACFTAMLPNFILISTNRAWQRLC